MGDVIYERAFFYICEACAALQGCKVPAGRVASWHPDQCDWCLTHQSVTEPRDFRPRPKPLKGE